MPYSLTIDLAIGADARLPENCIPALHATFFQWLERADANLARRVDTGNGTKPFTVSGLTRDGAHAAFRITLLDDALYPFLAAGMAQRREVRVLGEVLPFAAEAQVEQRTYQELVERARQEVVVTLRFESPTSFRSNEMHYPFPDAVLVFASYLARWNVFAPEELWVDASWLEWLRRAVAVSRFRLETQVVKFKGYEQIGCVGIVQYRIAEPDRSLGRAIVPFNFLADYAWFCGTGHKTTQGMGQTHRVNEWRNA